MTVMMTTTMMTTIRRQDVPPPHVSFEFPDDEFFPPQPLAEDLEFRPVVPTVAYTVIFRLIYILDDDSLESLLLLPVLVHAVIIDDFHAPCDSKNERSQYLVSVRPLVRLPSWQRSWRRYLRRMYHRCR